MEISGFFTYKGLTIMQHESVQENFTKLINQIKPTKVLEIGTASGGLTLMIRDILDLNGFENTKLLTYDVYDPNYLRYHVNDGAKIDIKVETIFDDRYEEFENAQDAIDFVESEGVTLVLCDGGNKKNEFKLFSRHLKVGDIIMAHDYSPNLNYFEDNIKNKIWNWFEIQDSDINQSCEENNLVPFMEEEFRQIVWVCKIKEK
jgi:predicted O-methyltransferase YrrM